MRILSVDDSATMRQIIRSQLTRAGFAHIDEAGNGREALAMLGRTRYDLLITDWDMPEMGGRDLVREVRRREAGPLLPILMVTTASARADVVAALRAGVTGYIVKPFDAETLKTKVTQVIATT